MYVPTISSRVLCAAFLVFMEVVSAFVLLMIPENDFYYLACIGFNALIVIGLDKIGYEKIVSDLMDYNFLALLVQIAGFFIYWNEIPVEFYNIPIHLLTALQILRLMTIREEDRDGFVQSHPWLNVVNNRHMRSY